jgi:3-dehydroquinate dehydratase / shikimate dehydrogenase
MHSPLISVSVTGPSMEEVLDQIAAIKSSADLLHGVLVEWRFDLFSALDIVQIAKIKQTFFLPSIFTLRAERQGGSFKDSEKERLSLILQLVTLNPEYLDLEWDTSAEFIQQILDQYPHIKLILSHHDFNSTAADLEALFHKISIKPAYLYKIATMANSTLDALRMLGFCQQYSDRVIAICMGKKGQLTRIAAPLFGNPISYAALKEHQEIASGQLTLNELVDTYHYLLLNRSTKLFGLIGDPIEKSPSHHTHNQTIQQLKLNALYVKMCINANELEPFMEYAQLLRFGGLSVTMPLKEKIIPFLDSIDEEAARIGAVNTVIFKNKKSVGHNTDGIGALNAIEENLLVKNKTLIILGAGGASRAIAYEAKKRGARVIILNRDPTRGVQLASEFGCVGGGLNEMNEYADQYDILINATSAAMPIDNSYIRKHTILMDIKTQPLVCPFFQEAKIKGCVSIPGYRMFLYQALEQFRLWFGDSLTLRKNLRRSPDK